MSSRIGRFSTVCTILIIALICLPCGNYRWFLAYVCEFLIILQITGLMKGRLHKCALFIRFLYGLVLSCQLASILMSGNALSPLTLDNLTEANVIGWENLAFSTTLVVACTLFSTFSDIPDVIYGWFCVIPVILLFHNSALYEFYKPVSLVICEHLTTWKTRLSMAEDIRPLKTDVLYSDNKNNPFPRKKYNVIVIFVEGTSRAVLSPSLTPNLWGFMENSLYFTGYFNHTAATFRGLWGQQTSFYQMQGGAHFTHDERNTFAKAQYDKLDLTHLPTLPDILRSAGYRTYFQLSNTKNSRLAEVLDALRFDRIYTQDDVTPEQRVKWSVLTDLSDGDSFRLLWKNVQELHKSDSPFYYGLYTVGTHIGLDSPEIKYGDGSNPYLNKFHNMDAQFGKFLSSFQDSPIADDTIIVFTTDHASFPAPDFQQLFKTKSPYFVDEVPLIIYKKENTKTGPIEVSGRNSLDLAPTIMDMLGISQAPNMFLGCTLFDTDCTSPFDHLTTIGLEYYQTEGHHVAPAELTPRMERKVENIETFGDVMLGW